MIAISPMADSPMMYRPFLLQYPPSVSAIVDWSVQAKKQFQSASTSVGSTRIESEAELPSDTSSGKSVKALHTMFDAPSEVRPWDPKRFQMVGKVQEAARNKGHVDQMSDTVRKQPVAVKEMPNHWIRESHQDFVRAHPHETEQPWVDIGCTRYLNNISFPYACELVGVYKDETVTRVVSELASEGDLFSWCGAAADDEVGPAREAAVRPVAKQIIDSVRRLHELYLVHRDLSLENILLSKKRAPEGVIAVGDGDQELCVQVIDYGMASTSRVFENCVRGKPSYQAPEVHESEEYDGFLSDAFSIGVTLYALLFKDYPWLSTKPGGCKCFEFVKRNGFRAYVQRRKLRGQKGSIADHMTPECLELLGGLLELDPAKRLTLGEANWGSSRPSVMEEPWMLKED